ncbi:DUF5343 domain-containing protein [Candidatus Bathyarchaeota archaeon]|nr:DUF5343 domain-containing protein [Candidatus Bathyarchaeota archaeon]
MNKIKTKQLGVPDRVNREYLQSIGYTSSNDFPIAAVLKSIGFIDGSNVPTQRFKDFRTEKSGQVMAAALKETYDELFKIHPEADKKSNEELENFFASKKPELKSTTLRFYNETFKTLCEFADFGAVTEEQAPEKGTVDKEVTVVKKGQVIPQVTEGLAINLNIQITLPITENAEVYDKIFKALRENIFSKS